MLRQPPIGALWRFWAFETQRIIPGTALIDDLRKRIIAQRLGLSTCKAGALPTELRPRALMSIVVAHQTRKNACVTTHSEPKNRTALEERLLFELFPICPCSGSTGTAVELRCSLRRTLRSTHPPDEPRWP